MDADALIAAACPTINEIGWAHYFAPETVAKGEAVGLDVFHLYFLGRGGVLGAVDASQVYSAFGYFNPELLARMWDEAKAISDPRAAATLYMECCADVGRSRLAGINGLEQFCETAGAINAAADPTGLALYAGIAAQPLVEDAPGRAMQLVSVLRELRGCEPLSHPRSMLTSNELG
ncbi:MAG: helix-turn-helix domain-containing protein [Acidimicrobiales bacterium]